jgi:hypothetical protein
MHSVGSGNPKFNATQIACCTSHVQWYTDHRLQRRWEPHKCGASADAPVHTPQVMRVGMSGCMCQVTFIHIDTQSSGPQKVNYVPG